MTIAICKTSIQLQYYGTYKKVTPFNLLFKTIELIFKIRGLIFKIRAPIFEIRGLIF